MVKSGLFYSLTKHQALGILVGVFYLLGNNDRKARDLPHILRPLGAYQRRQEPLAKKAKGESSAKIVVAKCLGTVTVDKIRQKSLRIFVLSVGAAR